MQDAVRANNQLPLTRNHLYAMAALSLSLALLSFFVGYGLGQGKTAAPPPPVASRFIDEEVRSGDLEVLLARVEQAAAESALSFPAELPRTDPPPAEPAEPAADGEMVDAAVDAEPPMPPEPPPNPFPVPPRVGSAQLQGEPAVLPSSAAEIPTSGWAVQVGEHASEVDAVRQVEELQAAGLSAYRVVALVGGQTMWRVRVGGYTSKDIASAAAPALASKAGARSTVITPAP
jgi:cell division protein FtsN